MEQELNVVGSRTVLDEVIPEMGWERKKKSDQ
jgi:hypothetical protein